MTYTDAEVRELLIKRLKREQAPFRGSWFGANDIDMEQGIRILEKMLDKGIITYELWMNSIDYGTVKLVK